ncbi:MAG: sigma-70 family RNA polymerase sigma factor [Mucilaginibacter sp.]|uniref:sigma-70 family RNA polymerase sigma factor n=1 Tax=Mucilaginibacter sp. TaxID=1882438 RepID=UPI003263B664
MRTKDKVQTSAPNDVAPHLWVDQYADYLFAYACLRIDDSELARDLVQDTFLGALERLEKFDRQCLEKTWLTAILKNKIFDVYRKKASGLKRQPLLTATAPDSDEFFDQEDGHWKEEHCPASFAIEQPDALQNKEFQGVLQSCMKKLPPLWASVFTMKHMDDESSETICTGLCLTSSNYWVIIHRSKVHLRSCLQKNWM